MKSRGTPVYGPVEVLETRLLMANVVVDAGQVVRPVDSTMVGTNICWWQAELDTSRMRQMISDGHFGLLRMPGGSSSNDPTRHFDLPAPWNGYKTPQIMAKVVESVGADGMISVNYGTGSPQEAAAYLAYYNASVGDPTVIGQGKQWNDSTRTWVWKNWKTAGYWASLRAAAPLTQDDGLNQLRANHPAPWGFTYWEVGNENFATWEHNEHTYGGTATATGSITTGNEPIKAFDESTSTKWVGQYSSGATLTYQFFNGEPQVVRQYRLVSAPDAATYPNRAPKNWVFEGSNNGTTWTQLDSQSNQSDISNSHEKTYNIPNTAAYSYYRLRITALRGTDTYTQLGELKLMYDVDTYTRFAKTFSDLAHQIYPAARVGLVSTLPMQWNLPNQNWTDNMLQISSQIGLTPGFLSDHVYVGGQTDQNLLLNSVGNPGFSDGWAPENWAGRTSAYRSKLNTWLGSSAAGVEIMLTEFNSDLGSKQSTSLVNGLFIADAMALAMQTEYTTTLQWDLTNGYTSATDDPTHYGWRTGNDNGMISTGSGPAPASGAYVPYPAYFGASLAGRMVANGQSVIRVTSDDPSLSAYAVRQNSGDLYLLVINKSSTSSLTGNFSLAGFYTTGQAGILRYGKAEDTAQSLTSDGAAAFTSSSQMLSVSNSSFTYSFPSYSMTLIQLTKAPAPPSTVSMQVNDGNPQRSMVSSVLLTFDLPVTVDPSALSLSSRPTNYVISAQPAAVPGNSRQWIVTFSGTGIFGGSLPDAIFRLTLSAAQVHDAYGQPLSGGDRVFSFHRLFGDSDGDRDVDNTDLAAFRRALNRTANYVSWFDYDSNTAINVYDLQQFKTRLNRRVLR